MVCYPNKIKIILFNLKKKPLVWQKKTIVTYNKYIFWHFWVPIKRHRSICKKKANKAIIFRPPNVGKPCIIIYCIRLKIG